MIVDYRTQEVVKQYSDSSWSAGWKNIHKNKKEEEKKGKNFHCSSLFGMKT